MSKETYYQEHSACPTCGSDDIESTCAGRIYQEGIPYKDSNKSVCHGCGWVGLVHDLVKKIEEK